MLGRGRKYYKFRLLKTHIRRNHIESYHIVLSRKRSKAKSRLAIFGRILLTKGSFYKLASGDLTTLHFFKFDYKRFYKFISSPVTKKIEIDPKLKDFLNLTFYASRRWTIKNILPIKRDQFQSKIFSTKTKTKTKTKFFSSVQQTKTLKIYSSSTNFTSNNKSFTLTKRYYCTQKNNEAIFEQFFATLNETLVKIVSLKNIISPSFIFLILFITLKNIIWSIFIDIHNLYKYYRLCSFILFEENENITSFINSIYLKNFPIFYDLENHKTMYKFYCWTAFKFKSTRNKTIDIKKIVILKFFPTISFNIPKIYFQKYNGFFSGPILFKKKIKYYNKLLCVKLYIERSNLIKILECLLHLIVFLKNFFLYILFSEILISSLTLIVTYGFGIWFLNYLLLNPCSNIKEYKEKIKKLIFLFFLYILLLTIFFLIKRMFFILFSLFSFIPQIITIIIIFNIIFIIIFFISKNYYKNNSKMILQIDSNITQKMFCFFIVYTSIFWSILFFLRIILIRLPANIFDFNIIWTFCLSLFFGILFLLSLKRFKILKFQIKNNYFKFEILIKIQNILKPKIFYFKKLFIFIVKTPFSTSYLLANCILRTFLRDLPLKKNKLFSILWNIGSFINLNMSKKDFICGFSQKIFDYSQIFLWLFYYLPLLILPIIFFLEIILNFKISLFYNLVSLYFIPFIYQIIHMFYSIFFRSFEELVSDSFKYAILPKKFLTCEHHYTEKEFFNAIPVKERYLIYLDKNLIIKNKDKEILCDLTYKSLFRRVYFVKIDYILKNSFLSKLIHSLSLFFFFISWLIITFLNISY